METTKPEIKRHSTNGSAPHAATPMPHTQPEPETSKSRANPLVRLIRAGVTLYGVVMLLYLALRRTVGERVKLVAVANSVSHMVLLPTILLAPLTWLMGWKREARLLAYPLWKLLLWYPPYIISRGGHYASPDARRVTLLTFNQRALGEKAADLARVIREADADFVAMQELHPDTAAYMARELADVYPHQALHPTPEFVWGGQGILSKFPIVEDDYRRPTEGHTRAVLDIDGRQIVFYNVHARYPFNPGGLADRRNDVRSIRQHGEAEALPVLFAGDFNMTAQTEDYGHMREAFTDVYRVAGKGLGLTYSPESTTTGWVNLGFKILALFGVANRPIARIDFMFHGEGWRAQWAYVLDDSGGSDHYPVKAELALL